MHDGTGTWAARTSQIVGQAAEAGMTGQAQRGRHNGAEGSTGCSLCCAL
jgi:hypothetical protein